MSRRGNGISIKNLVSNAETITETNTDGTTTKTTIINIPSVVNNLVFSKIKLR